jgi:hypothetical protein
VKESGQKDEARKSKSFGMLKVGRKRNLLDFQQKRDI